MQRWRRKSLLPFFLLMWTDHPNLRITRRAIEISDEPPLPAFRAMMSVWFSVSDTALASAVRALSMACQEADSRKPIRKEREEPCTQLPCIAFSVTRTCP